MANANVSKQTFYGSGTWTAPAGITQVVVKANKFWSPGVQNTTGFIDAFGRLWGMGPNQNGQLGNNAIAVQSSPVLVLGGLTFRKAVLNSNKLGSIGLTTTGTMYAWGSNSNGQGGTGNTTTTSSPILVVGGLLFNDFEADPWQFSVIARTAAGQLYAWGDNPNGNLGTNDVTPRSSPTLVVGGLTFGKVFRNFQGQNSGATIYNTVAALDNAGNCYMWGQNVNGQLGNNNTTPQSSPVLVVGGLTFQDVKIFGGYPSSFAGNQSCSVVGLTTAGQAYGWGYNANGQLGTGNTTSVSSPVLVVGGLTFTRLFTATGSLSVYGQTASGAIYAWGYNNCGQLGTNDITPRSSPTLVVGGLSFANLFTFPTQTSLSSQSSFAIGLLNDGTAYAWGSNGEGGQHTGVLGNNTNIYTSSPTLVVGGLKFKGIWSSESEETNPIGGTAVYGATLDGRVFAWGGNRNGELGLNNITSFSSPVLVLGGLGAGPLDTITDEVVTVVPGTTYNVTFSANGASFAGTVVGQTAVDSVTLLWE